MLYCVRIKTTYGYDQTEINYMDEVSHAHKTQIFVESRIEIGKDNKRMR